MEEFELAVCLQVQPPKGRASAACRGQRIEECFEKDTRRNLLFLLLLRFLLVGVWSLAVSVDSGSKSTC